jgi:hypothetical protein
MGKTLGDTLNLKLNLLCLSLNPLPTVKCIISFFQIWYDNALKNGHNVLPRYPFGFLRSDILYLKIINICKLSIRDVTYKCLVIPNAYIDFSVYNLILRIHGRKILTYDITLLLYFIYLHFKYFHSYFILFILSQ